MEKIVQTSGMVELVAAPGKLLHLKGTAVYVPKAPVLLRRVDDWEEVDGKPPYTDDEYAAEVERLIALRYSTGKEIQFAREREAAGEKYTEYLAYVESCKARAVENLTARDSAPVTQEAAI